MNLRLSTPAKVALRSVAGVLLVLFGLPAAGRSAAQTERVINTRIGLVNAYEGAQAAYESGAGWELIRFRWDELQPGGPADWYPSGPTGDWLGSARASGREVVGVLVGTPAWATKGTPGTGVPSGLYLPVGDPGNPWAAFVRQAVAYYSPRGIDHWVIWEDPDIPPRAHGSKWDGSLADYYQLVKVAYLVAKEKNPNAQIHLGGIGQSDPTWFDRLLDVALDDPTAPANDYYFDIATVHVFFSPDSVSTLAANPFYLMGVKGVPLKPVWINQSNARPAVDPGVYPDNATFREFSRVTIEQQAAFIIQSYALGFAAGADRMATYRLVDSLAEDDQQAFGLVRADGTPRPAYTAFQIVTQEFNGFVFARRVAEETHPLIDYVRLTFPQKVTHIAWARTEKTATLVIPARSTQATLIDVNNNRWLVRAKGGEYRLVVGGADCNEPSAPSGCMIGGAPWLLVETDVEDPLNETPPSVTVEEGGTLPTPDPGMALTATARAKPTETPTPTATVTPLPSPTPSPQPPPPTVESTPAASVVPTLLPTPLPEVTRLAEAPEPVEEAPPVEEQPPAALDTLPRPRGLMAILPFLLIGIGVLVVAGGTAYFLAGRSQPPSPEGEPDESYDDEDASLPEDEG